jgi:hypothetical protein
MTNTKKFAQLELNILAETVPDAVIVPFTKEILDLCEAFGKSGQSGASAPYVASAISQAVKKLLIKEELTPWAAHFQDVVRKNRKGKLNESAFEGILNGRMFYAHDAIKAGLIDSVASLDSVIIRATELSRKNNIRKIFKH